MPRRLNRWFDPFLALQHLRDFLASRVHRATLAAQPLAKRLGRAARPLTAWLHARSGQSSDDEKMRPAKLELQPMDWRNAPSESIAQTALPLAATAAAAAAAVYFAATLEANDRAVASAVAAERIGSYDSAPASISAVTLDPVGTGSGSSMENQTAPALTVASAAAPDESNDTAASAIDGSGSTLRAIQEDEFGKQQGGGGGSGSLAGSSSLEGNAAGGSTNVSSALGEVGGNAGSDWLFDGAGAGNGQSYFLNPGSGGNIAGGVAGASDAPASGNATANGIAASGGNSAGAPNLSGDSSHPVKLFDTANQAVRFVANMGQWADDVDFVASAGSYQTSISRDAMSITLPRSSTGQDNSGTPFDLSTNPAPISDTIRIEWNGLSPGERGVGEGQLASVSNFLIGNDRSQWRTNVPEYQTVRYSNAWDGVDLVYRQGEDGNVRYDAVVKPGASAGAVGFTIRGADARVDEQGRLVLTTPAGTELVQRAPVIFQEGRLSGQREFVSGSFTLREDGSVGFAVGGYDPTRELIIDPTLSYAVTIPQTGQSTVATDSEGNAYVVSSLPVNTQHYDAGITKVDPLGNIIWTTYVGGTARVFFDYPANDGGLSVAVDSSDCPVFVGVTNSSNFPTTPGAYQTSHGGSVEDGFLCKLSGDGSSLIYSTYLGGSGNESISGLAIDPNNDEPIVVGTTLSNNFPTAQAFDNTYSGFGDAFVARFNSSATALVFSTFLGGSSTLQPDRANGVAVESTGHAVVVGVTQSTDFPTTQAYNSTPGAGYISRFSPTGQLTHSTYFTAQIRSVAVDSTDNVYLTGVSGSAEPNIPLVNAFQTTRADLITAFVTKFSSLATTPIYSTYLGGTQTYSAGTGTGAFGITVDSDDRAIVVGQTNSRYFPTINAPQPSAIGIQFPSGGSNAFISRFTPDGSTLDFSTYWAGTLNSGTAAATGYDVALDLEDNIYVAGSHNPGSVLLKYGPPATPVISGFSDDTGSSGTDRLTYDTTPTFYGIGEANSTISLYMRRADEATPTLAGTTTAVTNALWTYTFAPFTTDGTYIISATSTKSGQTSAFSAPFTFTLDTTPPVITLSVISQTYDRRPPITVSATDLNGLSSPATVTLDADLNYDGDFLDVGESDFAIALLANGAATFTTYSYLTVGTITNFRARVTDKAGNEGSATKSVNVLSSLSNWPAASITPSILGGYSSSAMASLLYAGDVTTSHVLDLDVSPVWCAYCQDKLIYHSQEAAPAPTVQAVVQSDNARGLPSSVVGTLTWDGGFAATKTWSGTQLTNYLSPGGAWVFGIAPTSGFDTGRHTYTLDLFLDYSSGSDVSTSVAGQTFVVNRADSPYGAGWSFSNTDTLIEIEADGDYPAGVLRLYGSGGWAFYEEDGDEYISPPGDAGTLSFIEDEGWEYEAVDGTIRKFDLLGRMTSQSSPSGDDFVEYTYVGEDSGTAAKLLRVENSDNGVATFVYDSESELLTTITTEGGANDEPYRETAFFHTDEDLTQIIDPDDEVHTFSYDGESHRLIGEKFSHFQRTFTYSNGRASSYVLGDDPIVDPAWDVGLDDAGKALPEGYTAGEITDALNHTQKVWFDDAGREMELLAADGGLQKWKRDIDGYVTNYIDALGRVTTYTVDDVGNILQEIRPDGTSASWEYNGPYHSLTAYTDYNGNPWVYINDAYGRPISVTDPLNRTTTITYSDGRVSTTIDALGQIQNQLYDVSKRPTETLIGGAGTGTTSYDGMGNPNTYEDALSNVTTSIYDAMGRVTGTIDPLGNRTTTVYDGEYVRSTTDAAGNVTSYAYNTVGQVEAMIEAYGTGLERRTTYVYDAANRLIATVDPLGHRTTSVLDSEGRVVAAIDALGNQTAYQYNLVGNLIASVDALGRVTFYEYDLLGRLVSVTNPLGNTTETVYDNNSNVIATVDALGHRSTSVYDAADRLIASVDALGHRITYGYDAIDRQVSVTDPLGNTTTTVYDARNRVESTIDALNKRTTYGYDAADNLITITDANGNVTTNVYDVLNRQIATIDALGNITTTVYDAAGRVSASVDELGNRTTTVYDGLNRAIATIDALGNRTTTVYDAADRVIASIDARGNSTTAVYDAVNRLVATIDALGNRNTSVYDAVGNVIAGIDAIGKRTTYTIDALDRVIATTDPLRAVSSVSYDAAGRVITSTDPLGRVTTYVYDNTDRQIATIDALGNRSTTVYDAASNVVAVIDALGHRSTSVYDELNRVEATIDALNHRTSFLYDNVGNMVATVDAFGRTTTSVYDAINREIATIDALNHRSTVVFDAASNMIATVDALGNRSTWVYDALHRVQAAVDALGNRTTTTYDAAGNVRTTVDALNRTTTFAYDARNMPIAATDARGNVWTTQYDALGRGWREIDPLGNDTRTYFDAAGRVVETADQLGNRYRTVYDAAGNAIATVDPLGNRTTSVFDVLNRVEAIVDALGKRTTAVYDAAGNMVASIDALGRRTTAVFDALNRVEASIDALGNRSTSVYDAVGNVVSSIDALGRRTTAIYDELDRVVEVQDALGNRSTSVYDAVGNPIATIDALNRRATTVFDALNRAVANVDALSNRATSVYDAAGQVIASIDALGNRTTATFDAVGNVIETKDALGNVTTSVYDAANRPIATIDALGRRVTTTYDARGLVVAVKDAVGTITQAVYDAAGNTLATVDGLGRRTTSVYDALNRVIATVDALGNRSTTTFDAVGNVVSTKGVLNRTTTYGYDTLNRVITVTDSLAKTATSTYDAVGNLIASTNSLNQTTTFGYDALDRQITTTDPLGHTSTVVFDAAGQMIASVDALGNRTSYGYDVRGLMETATDPLGNVTTSAYDAAGNRTAETNARGFTTTAVYDALNRQVATVDALGHRSTSVFDAVGQLIASVDQLNYRTSFGYDARGRQITVTDPLNHRSTTAYDLVDNVSATTDALGNTTTFVYDALNRQIAEVDPRSFRTTSIYDAAGNRTALVDAVGNRTTWIYDALDRVITETDPLNASATFAYDAVGRKVSETDRLGRRRAFAYDATGRVETEKWYATGGALTQTQTWTYDNADRMLTAQDPDGTYTFAYDAAGRLNHVDEPFGLSLTMGYDTVGNRTRVEDSLGGVTTVTFDARNRQLSERVGGSGVSAMRFDRTYTARGELETLTRYSDLSGTTTVALSLHEYDAAGRQAHLKHTDGSGSTLAEFTYTHDAANRLTEKIENGASTTFAYDKADQLTQDGSSTFSYDGTGNRTNPGYSTSAGNRLQTDGISTFTYDANGNLVQSTVGASGPTWVYGYDNRNQLVSAAYSATLGGAVTQRVTYAYDAFGVRIAREAWDGSTTTTSHYGYDGWDPGKPAAVGNEAFDVWAELDASNTLVSRYTWSVGFNEVTARQDAGGAVSWQLTDYQQSVRMVIDNSATTLASTTYSAYGEITGGTVAGVSGFIGYTGYVWDPVLQLWVTPARIYNPETGRFMQVDLLGFAAGDVNLFRYVRNGPTNAVDPSGLSDDDFLPLWFKENRRTINGVPEPAVDWKWWKKEIVGDANDAEAKQRWRWFDWLSKATAQDPGSEIRQSDLLRWQKAEEGRYKEFKNAISLAEKVYLKKRNSSGSAVANAPAGTGTAPSDADGKQFPKPNQPNRRVDPIMELQIQIWNQHWWYSSYVDLCLPERKKDPVSFFNDPRRLYDIDPEYKNLVDELESVVNKAKIGPPPSSERLAELYKVSEQLLASDAMEGLRKSATALETKLNRRAIEVRIPRAIRFSEGGVWAVAESVNGTVEMVTEPVKTAEAIHKLATDSNTRKAVLQELEKKLHPKTAEDFGALTVDITSLISGAGGAAKTSAAVIKTTYKVTITIPKETAKTLRAYVKGGGSLTSKHLDELLGGQQNLLGQRPSANPRHPFGDDFDFPDIRQSRKAPRTGGPEAHNAANLARLNAELRLERTLSYGRIVGPKGTPIAVGERRIAVFDTQTGKIHHSWSPGGRHAGVLEEHGLPLAENRYVGGWIRIESDGRATFLHNSGTFPPQDLQIPRARLDDMIRGTGANPIDG